MTFFLLQMEVCDQYFVLLHTILRQNNEGASAEEQP